MEFELNPVEVRILGVLLEKEMATPDYYPLSLNALTNGCNQKSNRHPVVSYDETTVVRGLEGLKEKQLARQSNVSRVPKYEQTFTGPRNLIKREAAVLSVLLLRGPQTVGELRGRTDRLYRFDGLDEVSETLDSLEDLGFLKKMARQPGRKECRYAQLFAGEPAIEENDLQARPEAATLEVRAENERLSACEAELREIRLELADLRETFKEFKAQFE